MDSPRAKKGYFLLNNKKCVTRNGINLIGRNREAAVIMKNASVSQHHALLVILDDDKHYLSDFNSSNGTFLDSVKLQPFRLYEIKQGASVQFADIKSTYFKVTDNTEINTQGSESSQVVNDTLFNAETQLLNSSIISAQSANKTNHITDHGYTKLLEDDENFLNAASLSTNICNSPCDNHINEVVNDGNDSNSGDTSKTEEEIQESRTNHMNDHGYYKKTQTEDIHDDVPTPIKNKNVKSSLAEAIHDLPTQIVGGFDNESMQGQNTSIHELPTQMMHLPDVLEMSNLKDVEVSNRGDLLKEKVTSKPSTSSVYKLPARLSNISDIPAPKDVEDLKGDLSKEKETQKSCTLPKSITSRNSEQTQNEPPATDESVLETKYNNSNDIIDETLPDNLQQEQNPANVDENSTDSIDFMTMQAATQHFTDNMSSEDFNTHSKLHVSQQNRKVRNIIESDDETDAESAPDLGTSKIKRTKKKNVIDSSQETEMELADNKAGKARPIIEDSDSETDVEIDLSKDRELGDDKEKPDLDGVSSDKKVNVESEPKFKGDGNTNTMKTKPVIEDSDSETDDEIDFSKAARASDGKEKPCLNEVSSDKKVNVESESKFKDVGNINTMKTKPVFEDSDSETDDEIDFSKAARASDGKEKPCLNEVSSDKKVNVESESKFKDVGNINTTKTKPVFEDSDSETDDEIDFLKSGSAGDGKGKPSTSELTTDKKTNAEFEFKYGSTKIIKARPIIEDSDSETDVEIDIIKDQKASDADKDKSPHNEMTNDKRANEETAKTKTSSGSKNVDSEIDSDSDLKLIKVSKRKNFIESSDDTDVEDEIIKIDKEDSETDAESDNLSVNQKTKTNSKVDNKILTDASKAEENIDLDVSESTKGAQINQANNEENSEDNCQLDLFKFTKIDEDKKDEDKPDNKNESVNMNSDSKLDDTDVIPATQNSFVGEIDFDFNTQDLNYAAAKLEKANKENSEEKNKSNKDDTLNSEESLGDSFRLALTNSTVEAKHHGLNDENSTIDLFLQATQKNAEAEETNISRNNENESIFLKPTQKLDSKNDVDDDDDDEIFIQPTQQLSENQGSSEPSEEIFLQPQIIVTEKRLEAKSKDDSVFIKPTQKLATCGSNEEKAESISKPTQPNDDSIFLEATQKLSEKEEQGEVLFLKPAQVRDVHKNKLTTKPNRVEDNIFLQATQVISEEDNAAKTEKPDVNVNKKVVEDDDIFIQATQISPEVQSDNNEKIESQHMNSNMKLVDKDIFVQPTQVMTDELKENPPGHSVESQLEVMFASQSVRLIEDENSRPENPLLNLLSSLEIQPEVIEIKDDPLEETSNKENKKNAGPSKRPRTKSTDSNEDANIYKPKRGSRKSPLLSNDPETTKRNTRSTRNTSKNTEESDVPKVLNEEEKFDLLFKTTKIMENDTFLKSIEPVEKPIGRTRRSPQPVGKKAETREDNENLKSLRKKTIKTSLATVEEQPELPSKLDEISTPLENKVSAAGQQLEEEGKLQSKKRNVKSTKRADNVGEGTSSDNIETVVKPERSRKQRAKKDEITEDSTKIVNIPETPRRSTKRTRNNNIEIMHLSDTSSDSDVPFTSDLPSTSKKNIKESAKKSTKLKDNEEVTEDKKSAKGADNVGEETSCDNIETVVKPERSRRQRAKKDEEITEGSTKIINILETPRRSTKRTRNNNIEIMHISDTSNDSDVPFKSDLPSTSKKDTKESVDTKKSTKLKDKEEVTEEKKSTKRADNVGEETSSEKVETVVKPERSRRQKAKKNEEITEDIESTKITNISETPHRSTRRTRNDNIEIMHLSDSSNDFDVPLRSDLPSTSKKTIKESVDTKKSTKLKDSEEVTEEKTPGGKGKIKSKILKLECDQKLDVKEKKQRTKRTNSAANDETEEKPIKNVKRTRFDSTENESIYSNTPGPLESETPSTSKRTRSKRTQSSATIEEENFKPGADTTSDDEFTPSVARKKRKNVLDSDSDDITSQRSVKTVPGTPTRKKLLQLPDNSLSTPERLKRKLKPKVVFTMLDSPELESLIRSLGGSVVDTIEASTVLVTSGVKRSQKLLSAVGLGKPICSAKWLHECRKAGCFLDPWDHILVDDEAEKKWHFSLKESLQRSVDTKLLENYIVHLIVNNAQDVLKGAIESCGGKCVTRAPPKNSTGNYIIVSTPENKSKYTKFLKQIPQPMVVAPEAIFDGILRQELHFKDHKLT